MAWEVVFRYATKTPKIPAVKHQGESAQWGRPHPEFMN